MPFEPKIIPQFQTLATAAQNGNLVPLIGAGISKQASNEFPTWSQLLSRMKDFATSHSWIQAPEAAGIDELLQKNAYLMAAEELRTSAPTRSYEQFLREQFQHPQADPAPIHQALFELKPPLIMTTNYDTLLEDAFAAQFHKNATSWTPTNAPDIANYLHSGMNLDGPPIFKLHGSISAPSNIVFTERDYRRLKYWQPGYRAVVSAILMTRVVLMLGFSGDDPDLRLFQEGMQEALEYRTEPDYIFLERGKLNDVEKRSWLTLYGLEVIEYDASPGHPEVLEFVRALGSPVHP